MGQQSNAAVDKKKRDAADADQVQLFNFINNSPLNQSTSNGAKAAEDGTSSSTNVETLPSSKKRKVSASGSSASTCTSVLNAATPGDKNLAPSSQANSTEPVEDDSLSVPSAIKSKTNSDESVGSSQLNTNVTSKAPAQYPTMRKALLNSFSSKRKQSYHTTKSKTCLDNSSVTSAKSSVNVGTKHSSKSLFDPKRVVSKQSRGQNNLSLESRIDNLNNSVNSSHDSSVISTAFNSESAGPSDDLHSNFIAGGPDGEYSESSLFAGDEEKKKLEEEVEYWKSLAMKPEDRVIRMLEKVCDRLDSLEKKTDANEKVTERIEKKTVVLEKGIDSIEIAFRSKLTDSYSKVARWVHDCQIVSDTSSNSSDVF